MSKESKVDKDKQLFYSKPVDSFGYDCCNACSARDCTGLIPSAPLTEEEMDAYREIYDFEPPTVTVRNEQNYKH